MADARKQQILAALTAELGRSGGKVDPLALATAIDRALDTEPSEARPNAADAAGPGASAEGAYASTDEGRTPAELNASNDDGRG